MPDTTPDPTWATEQLATAQQAAVRWASKAEQTALDADINDDYADDRAAKPYLSDAVTDARRKAQALRSRSADASRLAEMWTRVATALAPSTNGQPTAYDLTVQLDPHQTDEDTIRKTGEDIVRKIQHLRRSRPDTETG